MIMWRFSVIFRGSIHCRTTTRISWWLCYTLNGRQHYVGMMEIGHPFTAIYLLFSTPFPVILSWFCKSGSHPVPYKKATVIYNIKNIRAWLNASIDRVNIANHYGTWWWRIIKGKQRHAPLRHLVVNCCKWQGHNYKGVNFSWLQLF